MVVALRELELEVPEGVDEKEWVERAVRARETVKGYAKWMWPWYEDAAHLEWLAWELEEIEAGANTRLIVEIPVRHGKSYLASVAFPAWYLLRNPMKHVIDASYGAELGHEFGALARNLVADPRSQMVFPGVHLAPDSRAKHRWRTNFGGSLLASGIPGPITGRGGNLFNIDDPIKSWEEAESPTYRESIWNWWKFDARTRLEPGGAVVVSCARWHDDDFVGRLLNDEGSAQWRVLRFPAIATDASGSTEAADEVVDDLGRRPGDALWPTRFDRAALDAARRDMGERAFAALYQQDPVPEGGSVFTVFEEYDHLPAIRQVVIGIDTAFTSSEKSDFSAWAAWGITADQRAYLIQAGDMRQESTRVERYLAMFYQQMCQQFPDAQVIPVVRKQVAPDRIAGQHLSEYAGLPVRFHSIPRGDLEAIAHVVAYYFEAAKVYIPKQAGPWLTKWRDQHLRYPAGAHDDYVATTVYALHWVFRRHRRSERRRGFDIYGEY